MTQTTDNTMEQKGDSRKDDLNNRSIKIYLHKGLDIIIPEQTHGEDKVLCIFAQLHCAQLEKNSPLYKYLSQKRHYYSRILVTTTLHQIRHRFIHSGKCIKTKSVEYIRAHKNDDFIQ
jgi:hypothetical protein